MLTQEQKFFLQKASPSGIEKARDLLRAIQTNNDIEKEFVNDLLTQISGHTEKEYEESVEESGIFYFFNDYQTGRK